MKDITTLHNVGQKYIAEKLEGPFWSCHAQIKSLQPKFKEYLQEFEHRVSILQETPRTGTTAQTQEVIGMFIEYDASKGLQNQAMTATQIMLDFSPQHAKHYEELSKTVLDNYKKMECNDSVLRFVRLCAIDIKYLYGCSVNWDGEESDAPASKKARPAGAGPNVRGGAGPIAEKVGGPKTQRVAAGSLSTAKLSLKTTMKAHIPEQTRTSFTVKTTIAAVITSCLSCNTLMRSTL